MSVTSNDTPLPRVNFYIEQIKVRQAGGQALETAVRDVRLSFEANFGPDPDREADITAAHQHIEVELTRQVEFLTGYSVKKMPRPDWYRGPNASDRYWPKLRAYLTGTKKWSSVSVDMIDCTSSEVVSLLRNPAQTEFRGRGLVVGYVQSGKTANMTAVISKAIDAGYRFIIVLAGLTNSLRYQTQNRFQLDLVDRDPYGWRLHTKREMKGDLVLPPTPWFALLDEAQLAVVKKNVTPLRNLLTMLKRTPPTSLRKLPILIVDDECDEASVNSREYNITAINKLIRQILHQLPRVQYVGYSATPFANVLINPYAEMGGMDDLYPEDFITALPKPDGYFGAADLFGEDLADASADGEGLDMIRSVHPDEVQYLRPASRAVQGRFEPQITPSLEAALRYFLLASACRRARGQPDQHSSMLVHTTVYTAVHHKIATEITRWLLLMIDRVQRGDTVLRSELEALWIREQARVSAAQFENEVVDFAGLWPLLPKVLEAAEVIVENSRSDSRLDYGSGPKTYIVVGGSVLARGLTIEGLSVSLFLRSSNQYDTLLQMGRWFGYRPNYEDLPRIWMTDDLSAAFEDLSRVELEIREDITQYVERNATPMEVAVKIRQIPGMAITAAGKMFHARRCDVSFSNEHAQTIRFRHRDSNITATNWAAAGVLLNAAQAEVEATTARGGRLFKGVSHAAVEHFLRSYQAEPNFQKDELLDYLTKEVVRPDQPIRTWNVAVIEPGRGEAVATQPLGPLKDLRLSTRARMQLLRGGAADIKALMSRADILIDTDLRMQGSWAELKAARTAALAEPTPLLLIYPIDRNSQPRKEGGERAPLEAIDDLIGIGVVLPDRGEATSYVAVALQQEDAAETEDLAAELDAETEDA